MTVPVTGHTHRMEMSPTEHLSERESVHLTVDDQPVELVDVGGTLLDALRGPLDRRSVKDGCSPQGQCGCCTVLVDGQPRVSCVTPLRRVAGRSVTTLEGLSDGDVQRWSEAFCATGGSQCGFCTPGIILRFAGLEGSAVGEPPASRSWDNHFSDNEVPPDRYRAARALNAHQIGRASCRERV